MADAPAAAAAASDPTEVELRQARVLGVHEGGMADRVALDFTTLLGADEVPKPNPNPNPNPIPKPNPNPKPNPRPNPNHVLLRELRVIEIDE